ncbi:uncharacterized protein LOC117636955 [Prunus dulcis]|uniref:uncharacterized protein LOC117636955 n=1 Tax=Prunus dulcis TaxID=3755 RepID=UPI001482B56C|nr:uncharacterized protein LOC117636955 [Prunus dulcis]
MEKSWMLADRRSKEYEEGVEEFLRIALANVIDHGRICYPCQKSRDIDEDIFGVEKMIYVLKEDVISFIQMNEIGQAVITAYIRYLNNLVKDQEWEPKISFMDPSRTFHDPNSPDEAGRVQYIVKALNQTSIDNIFLIPYNPGGHWILTIIDEERDNVYIMDPLGARYPHDIWKRIGAPKQADGKTCGYCVMRYMKEICEDSSLAFRTKYASRRKKVFYTQMELDKVRDEWAHHVLEWI